MLALPWLKRVAAESPHYAGLLVIAEELVLLNGGIRLEDIGEQTAKYLQNGNLGGRRSKLAGKDNKVHSYGRYYGYQR